MRNLFILAFCGFVASCSSVMSDVASFKDPSFNEREPSKNLALIINNASMQNINRMQISVKEALNNENIDVNLLDHYTVNPPTRKLSEKELISDLKNKWNADSILYIDVLSEVAKDDDQDSIDLNSQLLKKDDLYKSTAYGKYSARLIDVKSWNMIWKADLISIDEKFANTKKMYDETSQKIVDDLLDKNLLIKKGKRKNNSDSFKSAENVEVVKESYNSLNDLSVKNKNNVNPAERKVVSYDDLSEDDLIAAEENMNRVANGMPAKMPVSRAGSVAPAVKNQEADKIEGVKKVSRAGAVKKDVNVNSPVQGRVINPKDMEVPSDVSVRPMLNKSNENNALVKAVPANQLNGVNNGQAMIEKKSSVVSDSSYEQQNVKPEKIVPADINKKSVVSANIEEGQIF